MTSKKEVTVDPTELRDAFEFVSVGNSYDTSAYISLDTGKVYWVSDVVEDTEELPDDFETSDRYIAVPNQKQLDLGRRLVLSFIEQELPDEYEIVAGFFRRKGAYGRIKDLLESRSMLQKWYDYENHATDEALRGWCEENGIRLVAKQS